MKRKCGRCKRMIPPMHISCPYCRKSPEDVEAIAETIADYLTDDLPPELDRDTTTLGPDPIKFKARKPFSGFFDPPEEK